MNVLDSLIRNLPVSESRFEMTRKDMWSELVNSYPGFRSIAPDIASKLRSSLTSDPSVRYYDILENLSMKDLEDYWSKRVAGRPIVWAIVGDPDKIGMEELAKFGPITQLKPNDVMK